MNDVLQIYLTTQDLEESRSFYESVLALEPERIGDSSTSYVVGDVELKLRADHDPEEMREYGLEPPREPRGEGVFLVVELDDGLEDVAARASDAVLWGPDDAPWGGRMMLVESPAGYVYELR